MNTSAISKITRCLIDINLDWSLTYIDPYRVGKLKTTASTLDNPVRRQRKFSLGTGANAANIVANYTATLAAASSVTVDLYEGLYPMAGLVSAVRVTKIKAIFATAYPLTTSQSTAIPVVVGVGASNPWVTNYADYVPVKAPLATINSKFNMPIGDPWIAVNTAGFVVSATSRTLKFENLWASALDRQLEVYVIGEGLASY